MMGLTPIARVAFPVGDEQVAPCGLQTPITTEPPLPVNGRYRSVLVGTVMVRRMLVALTTVAERLLSDTRSPLLTIPTLVANKGSPLTTNPEPLMATVKDPLVEVGRAAGDRRRMAAFGALT